jgi:hypothetical protein
VKHFDYSTIKDTVVDAYGRRIVLSLFSEYSRGEFEPLWSLRKDWKAIYLEVADPTEYETAMCLIGDWEHYSLIRNHPKIKPVMDAWAEEVAVKLKSAAFRKLEKLSTTPNGTAAAKYISEGQFFGKGRKAKQITEEKQSKISERISEDMERLGLSVINGEK